MIKADSELALFGQRRFLPLFLAQILGIFNDNLIKFAVVFLFNYALGERLGWDTAMKVQMGTLATALLIIPYILFSPLAGQLADRFDRAAIIHLWKAVELPIVAVAGLALALESVPLLMVAVLAFGIQSTFFSPARYGLLPALFTDAELPRANGLFEGGIFLAVLLGTILGGALITAGVVPVIALAAVMAAIGAAAAYFVPRLGAAAPELRLTWNPVTPAWDMVRFAARDAHVFRAILGIGVFYLLATIFLILIPTFAESTLVSSQAVGLVFMTLFAVGIAIGSVLAGRLLGHEIDARFVPLALIGVAIACLWLGWTSLVAAPAMAAAAAALPDQAVQVTEAGRRLLTLGSFLAVERSWQILGSLLAIAIFGGLMVVPLQAMVQARTDSAVRSRVIAATNLIIALFTLAAAAAIAALQAAGLDIAGILLATGLATLVAALALAVRMARGTIRTLARGLFRLLYGVRIVGLENLIAAGPRAIIVPNHASYIDGPLLAAMLPDNVTFAINSTIAGAWWVRPWMRLVRHFPMDPTNPMALKHLIKELQDGHPCVVFPEGRISETGGLMKIYDGAGYAAMTARAAVVPIYVEGTLDGAFSLMKGKLRQRWFPRTTIHILPAERVEPPAALARRDHKDWATERLYDIMSKAQFLATTTPPMTLWQALLTAARRHGAGRIILEDADWTRLTYRKLIAGALVLGRKIAAFTQPREVVGVLLPNAAGGFVTLMALQATGRIAAMLNFSAGPQVVAGACATARVTNVLTSRRFVELGNLGATIAALDAQGVRITWLEDVRATVSLGDRLRGLFATFLPVGALLPEGITAGDPAVVLFTSGSEGPPKGVVLSHHNIVANIRQVQARIDFTPADRVFNALPMFHALGLTGATLLPILNGVRTMLYPSPLHYKMVPEMAYLFSATVMFGTDTFLTAYAKRAHPYDFFNMRFITAGAEKVREETRRIYADRFGVRIMEGYGATECAPTLSLNTFHHSRLGSVGRLMPAMEAELRPVPGIEEGGELVVSGPNIMLGYMKADWPGEIQPPEDGRYATGDIVTIDKDGYVRIIGRIKRFAKLAGEMVPLALAEALCADVAPDFQHAVVAIPDARKGERLVVCTTAPALDVQALVAAAQRRGATALAVPRIIHRVEELPVLGSGKTDYPRIEQLARSAAGEAPEDAEQRADILTGRVAQLV